MVSNEVTGTDGTGYAMEDFEDAFADIERTAEAARRSATMVAQRAAALVKAAREGDIAGIRRVQGRLDEALSALAQEVSNAGASWLLNEEEERRRLDEEYAGELLRAGAAKGLTMHERDGVLISYPSIVQVVPTERAVKIDRRRVSTLRPSRLVNLLLKNQSKSSGFSSQKFLECLYVVYNDIVGRKVGGKVPPDVNPVVPLARIYRLMTALPGAARDYGRRDFARDLYGLESQGPKQTKSGATVSFPGSTGPKQRASETFLFVDSEGHNIAYFGIRFDEDHD